MTTRAQAPDRSGSLETPDGLSVRWYEWGPGGGQDDADPPVLLHHGFVADAHTNFVAPGIVGTLVARGRRVLALDARGHGASDKPHEAARYGEARMAGDLRLLVDLSGAPRVHLVGYSMGAVVALLAASADKRVERLVIGGVGEGVLVTGGLDSRAVPGPLIVRALTAGDPAEIPVAAAGFRALADAVGADRLALAAHVEALHQERVATERVRVPTLLIAGDLDPLAVRPERLADALPDARLMVLPGDHMTVVGHPDLAPAIADFLEVPRQDPEVPRQGVSF